MVNSRNMKMTPVGLIPEDWEVIQLADYIVDINDGPFGSNLKSEHYTLDREVRIIQLGNVGDDGWNNENIKYTTFEHASTLKRCIVPYGTIIIAKMMPAGRAIICPSTEPAYIQGSDVIKVVFTDSINKDFFIYLTKSKSYLEQIESGVQGSTRARTNIGKIKSLKLPLPSVEEQKRIAGALLSVDKMIRALDEAIAKKRQIKEGLMQQLLTGKTSLPGFCGEWLPKNLGKSALIKARIGWQGLTTKEYLDSGVYYLITGTDFKDGRIDWKNCHYVTRDRFEQDPYIKIQKHDVLVSKDGTIGKVAYLDDIPGPGTLNSGVFVIRSKDKQISQRYLAKVFVSKYFDDFIDSIVAGSTIVHLYQKDIVKFDFMVPPSIEEQEQVCDFLEGVDNEIICLESKRDKYASLKQGMMQGLLTGKTRL